MNFYFFEFPKTGMGISGGEMGMIENIKYLQKNKHSNVLFTTDNASVVYEKFGLKQNEYLKLVTVNSFKSEKKFGVFVSYILRTFAAIRIILRWKFNENDILICNSDFFPNSIPFWLASMKRTDTILIYWWRTHPFDVFKGYKGQFTNTYHIPKLNEVHNKLNHVLYVLLTQKRGLVIALTPYSAKILKQKFNFKKVFSVNYGTAPVLSPTYEIVKKYDLLWLGRFQGLKGLSDFIEVVEILYNFGFKNLRVAIIGGGTDAEEKKMRDYAAEKNLNNIITWKGFLIGKDKDEVVYSSKVFVMTSYYESFARVILETMKCGLPVVSYDIPTYSHFTSGIVKVPIGDRTELAKSIAVILTNPELYQNLSSLALRFSQNRTDVTSVLDMINIIKNEQNNQK